MSYLCCTSEKNNFNSQLSSHFLLFIFYFFFLVQKGVYIPRTTKKNRIFCVHHYGSFHKGESVGILVCHIFSGFFQRYIFPQKILFFPPPQPFQRDIFSPAQTGRNISFFPPPSDFVISLPLFILFFPQCFKLYSPGPGGGIKWKISLPFSLDRRPPSIFRGNGWRICLKNS